MILEQDTTDTVAYSRRRLEYKLADVEDEIDQQPQKKQQKSA